MPYILKLLVTVILSSRCLLLATNGKGYYLKDHQKFNMLPQYPDCGRKRLQPAVNSRIKGGTYAALGEFPWIVYTWAYKANTFTRCGGSLINERYIISAAHCYVPVSGGTPLVRRIKIFLGDFYQDNYPDCVNGECIPPEVINYATHVYLDAKYSQTTLFKDFALLRLKDKAIYGDFIRPICLPFVNVVRIADLDGYKMTTAGWGLYDNRTDHSDYLWKITSKVSMKKSCGSELRALGYKMWNYQQCFSVDRNKSTCKGDSGGPVMLVTRVNTKCKCTVKGAVFPLGPTHYVHYLMAVISFGFNPCFGIEFFNYQIQTRTVPFLKWILDKIYE